jgi:hypothetical protein
MSGSEKDRTPPGDDLVEDRAELGAIGVERISVYIGRIGASVKSENLTERSESRRKFGVAMLDITVAEVCPAVFQWQFDCRRHVSYSRYADAENWV